MSNLRVAVVGGGAVGLSTASVVRRQWPNVELTVLAEAFNEATTSSVAAGYLIPHTVENAPDAETFNRWIRDSASHFRHLATGADAGSVSGVAMATMLELSAEPNAQPPLYCSNAFSCQRLTPTELDRHLPSASAKMQARSGHLIVTTFAESRLYLPYLSAKMLTGCEMVQTRVESLDELTESGQFHLVFNCSGLGARRLCHDLAVLPIRGQVVRVRAPHVKMAVYGPGANYVLPNTNSVVLGGFYERNCWDTSVRPHETEDILSRVSRRFPSLSNPNILGVHVGLRPHRVGGARVQAESGTARRNSAILVHNYGHGANGIALSWGSAEQAVQLAVEAVRAGRPRM